MKKWTILLLVLAILLCGCQENTDGNTDATQESTVATEPGLYLPGEPLEVQTNGAVRVFPLTDMNTAGVTCMGDTVLLTSPTEISTTITQISKNNGNVLAQLQVDQMLYFDSPALRVTDQKLAFWKEATNELVVYDSTLKQTDAVKLPEQMQGMPVISHNLDAVYYTTESELREFQVQKGISRLIRKQEGWEQQAMEVMQNGKILYCYTQLPGDEGYYEFINAETGETLGADAFSEYYLATAKNGYTLQRWAGPITEVVFSQAGGAPKDLVIDRSDNLFTIPNFGVLAIQETQEGLDIACYTFADGTHSGQLMVPGWSGPYSVAADGTYVWMLLMDNEANNVLLRWDYKATAPDDDAVYTTDHITAETPDVEAQAACRTQADSLEQKYGVKIAFADFAVPDDYTLLPEYQPKAIEKALTMLDAALAVYPDGFVKAISAISDSGAMHIVLVRGIRGALEGTVDLSDGLQYWVDGEAYLALVIGDSMNQTLTHELSHVLDSYVYSKNEMYETWDTLNPKGFQYYNNYTDYLGSEDLTLINGATKAFIDLYAMSYAKEDRARIFEYAMMDNAGENFAAPIMQAKLSYLCKTIRKTLGWQDNTTVLPWEQYLEKPLAPAAS